MRRKYPLFFICFLLLFFLSGCQQKGKEASDMDMSDMKMENHQDHDDMDMSEMPLDNHNQSGSPMDMSDMKMTSPSSKPTGKKKLIYRGPMHPWITSDKPGQCPICGMDLEPVYEDESTDKHANHSMVDGRVAVKISARRQQLIGVKTETVKKQPLKNHIDTVGKVDYNEQNISHVHTKYEGWLDEVFVDFTGKPVNRGQPLFTIYSPELVAAQQEYLLALRTAQQFRDSPLETTRETSQNLQEAARQKLKLWDMTDAQIRTLARSGHIQKNVTVYSPVSGYVIETKARQGMRVTAGTEMYIIANLSTVWINAQVYEYEMSQLKLGQHADISLPYLPGKEFVGKISYIYPYLEPKSRTVQVRITLNNSQGQLKPNMYANVGIQVASGKEELAIPVSAVMDSGQQKIAFVAKPDGYFEPRKLTLGLRMGDYYVLKTGVTEGEKVVIHANFLIDSESQLQSAVSGMAGGHQH